MAARLTIINGPSEGMSLLLKGDDTLILGRHPKANLRFLDDGVSSHHCRIFSQGNYHYIEDLGSTNGTYVNEESITRPRRLESNDEILIGDTCLTYSYSETESEETTESSDDIASTMVLKTSVFKAAPDEKTVGDYRLLQRLGNGATGEIFKAQNIVSAEVVALKILHSHCLDDVSLQRFLHEVNTCMSFDHPGIVKVFEFGMYQDRPLLIMEYIDGEALDRYLNRNGSMAPEPALKIAAQLSQALHYAHKRGVVHRDLNPANILLQQNHESKIIDFGIAKVYGKSITLACQTLGTLRYIPPEQIDDARSVDHRADIYALGATLYHLLYGKPPYFETQGLNALILKITDGRLRPLKQVMQIKKSISDLVKKAMAPNRNDRFSNVLQFFQAIIAELEI